MKKKNIITLEMDDEPLNGDMAHLMFHTTLPSYLLADSLNRLYGYNLHRIDDMVLEGAEWPFYTHADTIDQLKYYIIEKPMAAQAVAAWGAGDKILIIKGDGAQEMADYIYDDLTDPTDTDENDLLAVEHARLRDGLLAAFTVVTPLDLDAPLPTQNKKVQHDRATLQQQCAAIHTHIERQRLDLNEEEIKNYFAE